uniref:Uncharacterized protein n=1 Tax=Anguilla anguilla TaxID=7936 RepID=A0A0E9XIT3_ANGAN
MTFRPHPSSSQDLGPIRPLVHKKTYPHPFAPLLSHSPVAEIVGNWRLQKSTTVLPPPTSLNALLIVQISSH